MTKAGTGRVILSLAIAFSHAASAQAQQMPRAEYPDVPRGHWAYEAVTRLSQLGVIEGLLSGKYGGDQVMTRYELSVCIARCGAVSFPPTKAEVERFGFEQARHVVDQREPDRVEYADVPRGHWAYESVRVASLMATIEGLPDGTFGGNRSSTRYEGAVAMARFSHGLNLARKADSEKNEEHLVASYPDVPETHWAFHAIHTLNSLGVLGGFADGKFHGTKPMSRYEFAVAFARIQKLWGR